MLSPEDSRVALERLFRRRRVVNLPELHRALQTNSRMSVFRRLRCIGYRSSFTHRGGYYTLVDVPDFDVAGLWFYEDIGFSIYGTLKATLVDVVENSSGGMTHEELRRLLRTRSHDTLIDLIREGKLARRNPTGGRLVYVSVNPERAAKQLINRDTAVPVGPLAPAVIVEVLLEVIRAAEVYIEPEVVVTRLGARGLEVSVVQVMEVYAIHGVAPGKKTVVAPRSDSLRR